MRSPFWFPAILLAVTGIAAQVLVTNVSPSLLGVESAEPRQMAFVLGMVVLSLILVHSLASDLVLHGMTSNLGQIFQQQLLEEGDNRSE